MRILFALNQETDTSLEEKFLSYFKSITGREFEIVKEYDLSGVTNKFKFEKFDILVLNEELERDNTVTTTFIDDLTDKFNSTRVILVINSEHEKDAYVRRLFNIGVYDVLYGHDVSVENIVNLIINPRSKAEAKIYLDLHDIDDVRVESELRHIPEDELNNILNYFESIEPSHVEPTFEHICNQYNDEQLIYLIGYLPNNIKELLGGNQKYLQLLEIINKRSFDDIKDSSVMESDSEVQSDEKHKGLSLKNLIDFSKDGNKVKEKVIRENKYIHIKPDDYVKFAGFVGAKGKGKSLIIDLIARCLSSYKIDVAVLDATQSSSFYYKYVWGNEDISDKVKSSVTNLSNGDYTPYKVNKHYSLYSEPNLPITIDVLELVDKLKITSKVVLIDMDFSNNFIDLSKYMLSNIFIVHDLNILDIRFTKNLVIKLIESNVNPHKFSFLLNKYTSSYVTDKTIMEMFKNPINEMEEGKAANYFDFKDNKIFTLGFSEELYMADINISYLPEKKFSIPDNINDEIYNITNSIYMLPEVKKPGLLRGIFSR